MKPNILYWDIISGKKKLYRQLGTNKYPEIEWLIEYFIHEEEYEKCSLLKKIKNTLKRESKTQISKEKCLIRKMKFNKII